jgi:hypothetical protein
MATFAAGQALPHSQVDARRQLRRAVIAMYRRNTPSRLLKNPLNDADDDMP